LLPKEKLVEAILLLFPVLKSKNKVFYSFLKISKLPLIELFLASSSAFSSVFI